ncbi:PfkB family carbohydrate kinase [Saccharospirillum mangrovi]|uniref:PfkB family carbohydrate kinase n=1 Tax=Saccharospirillum mangrovi TaxID=2161747 RepID=UPI001300504C|nr:PfkB family carbohydrate kinase [Saccharospirillum mangrovi]
MKPLYAFGELLVDALHQDGVVEDGLAIPGALFYPGGAPANVAVAAARLGVKSFFIGQVGRDRFGPYLKQALTHYGVDTRYLRSTDAPTPMALVSLDEHGKPDFRFYRSGSADLLLPAHKLPSPAEFTPGVVHVASNTLTEVDIRRVHLGFVDRCLDAGNLISFDVNLRQGLWPGGNNFREPIKAMLTRADVIKVNRQEMNRLWEHRAQEQLLELAFANRAQAVFITDGPNVAEVFTRHGHHQCQPAVVTVVDVTAAGGAFCGVVVAALCSDHEPDWAATLERAVRAGGLAVGKRGAFLSLPTAEELG